MDRLSHRSVVAVAVLVGAPVLAMLLFRPVPAEIKLRRKLPPCSPKRVWELLSTPAGATRLQPFILDGTLQASTITWTRAPPAKEDGGERNGGRRQQQQPQLSQLVGSLEFSFTERVALPMGLGTNDVHARVASTLLPGLARVENDVVVPSLSAMRQHFHLRLPLGPVTTGDSRSGNGDCTDHGTAPLPPTRPRAVDVTSEEPTAIVVEDEIHLEVAWVLRALTVRLATQAHTELLRRLEVAALR